MCPNYPRNRPHAVRPCGAWSSAGSSAWLWIPVSGAPRPVQVGHQRGQLAGTPRQPLAELGAVLLPHPPGGRRRLRSVGLERFPHLVPVPEQVLHVRILDRSTFLHVAKELFDQSSPPGPGLLDHFGAELGPARGQLLALLGREVGLEHSHHLQGGHELLRIGHRRVGEPADQPLDLEHQPADAFRLLPQVAQLGRQQLAHRQQVVLRFVLRFVLPFVQRFGDLRKRQPEAAQRPNPVQPPQVVVGVAAMPRCRPLARGEQARLVVVVQRPNGDSARPCELTDAPPGAAISDHVDDARTYRWGRFKPERRNARSSWPFCLPFTITAPGTHPSRPPRLEGSMP